MKQASVRPDTTTYNTLMKLYVDKGDETNAKQVLVQMNEAKVRPDTTTYNTLMKLYVDKGGETNAKRILVQMNEATGAAKHVDVQHADEAVRGWATKQTRNRILVQMNEANVRPDTTTYNTLMKLYVDKGDETNAKRVLDRNETSQRAAKHDDVYHADEAVRG